jgi:hypothetical protein
MRCGSALPLGAHHCADGHKYDAFALQLCGPVRQLFRGAELDLHHSDGGALFLGSGFELGQLLGNIGAVALNACDDVIEPDCVANLTRG